MAKKVGIKTVLKREKFENTQLRKILGTLMKKIQRADHTKGYETDGVCPLCEARLKAFESLVNLDRGVVNGI